MKKNSYIFSLLLIVLCSCQSKNADIQNESEAPAPAAISLLGDSLYASPPSEALLQKFETHKKSYLADPENPDKLIWYARFIAYQGNYEEAIKVYSKGIEQFPEDARMYRHRGHRYISIRKFDEAIQDFERAVTLIEGKENEVEPDGMPNAQNIPVSTLHGNIWYHLGLAYYLKHDFEKALNAYQNCRATSTNADNIVSSTHWLYMILRRMGKEGEAKEVLDPIEKEMPVIENMAYHRATMFYKGLLSLAEITSSDEGAAPSNDALDYAIGNWYFYNGEKEKAKAVYADILQRDSWSSFGYIAAEKDWVAEFE